jgi:hypothetical protein
MMEADYDSFEIACVIYGFRLVDSESYERQYRRRNDRPLAPGYYVVHWPESIRIRRFNEHAVFFGPFKARTEAQAALERLQGLQATGQVDVKSADFDASVRQKLPAMV